MRVLIVDTYYPAFLDRHYEERPRLAAAGYDEQLQSLIERCFGTSDAYSQNLRRLGHDAQEVIVNCEPLQLRWAAERGAAGWRRRLATTLPRVRAARRVTRGVRDKIVAAQVAEFDAEVVYLQDLGALPLTLLDRLRGDGRLVVGQIASPPPEPKRLRRFDLLITSFPHFVERFRALGVDSEYLQIGFHAKVLERLGQQPSWRYEASFVGGLDPRVHVRGTAFLERLCSAADIDVWGYGAGALADGSSILRRYHGEAWGLDMYRVLRGSGIAINRHIDAAEGYSNNMRLFEATGVGTLLMTEVSHNLDSLFVPGGEVVSYEGVDDLIEKLAHYREHEDDRARIAAAGQARTLSEHSYERIVGELAEMLKSRL